MVRAVRIAVMSALALAIGACTAGEENVLFVTSTEVGIDADAKIGSVTIGVGRNEALIGPAYVDTGGTPPIIATLQSNLSVFSPKVSQLYATGNAARFASGLTTTKDSIGSPDDLSGTRRAMYFGTTSNIGLKLGFTEGTVAPTSFSLGYKRRELSIIPLIETQNRTTGAKDKYASVYAAIDMRTTAESIAKSGIELDQFFATGSAAEELAKQKGVRQVFQAKATSAAIEAAHVRGVAWAEAHITTVDQIVTCVQPVAGALDAAAKQRLATLVDGAAQLGTIVDSGRLKGVASTQALSSELIDVQQTSVDALLKQLATGIPACG